MVERHTAQESRQGRRGRPVLVVLLVLNFGSSSNLASAYGIAVTGTMLIAVIVIIACVFGARKFAR